MTAILFISRALLSKSEVVDTDEKVKVKDEEIKSIRLGINTHTHCTTYGSCCSNEGLFTSRRTREP